MTTNIWKFSQVPILLWLILQQTLYADCIYYGNDTTIEESGGFIVQLSYEGHFAGAGSLITPKFVLTAHHIIHHTDRATSWMVKAGSNYITETGQSSPVHSIKLHPAFDAKEAENDIAVLLLKYELNGVNIKPISICTRAYEDDIPATALGWGERESGIDAPKVLQKLEISVLNFPRCKAKMVAKHGILHSGMICTYDGTKRGICKGDSGGPLVIKGELCGIIIWFANVGCGNGQVADIHTNVYYYRNFIKQAMQELDVESNWEKYEL